MKKFTKIIAILFITCALMLAYATIVTANDTTTVASGKCGENVTWTLNGETLTISGTGRMDDYTEELPEYSDPNEGDYIYRTPWREVTNNISSVIIEDGVTYIGKNAFSYFSIRNIILGKDVEEIGNSAFRRTKIESFIAGNSNLKKIDNLAFYRCRQLKTVDLGRVEIIGRSVFSECYNLETIILPETIKEIGENAFFQAKMLVTYKTYAHEYAMKNGKYEVYRIPVEYLKTTAKLKDNKITNVEVSFEDKTLVEGQDYELEYEYTDRTATVWVKGKGIYYGSISHSYASIPQTNRIPFEDIAQDTYYYSSIVFCYRNNLISGTTQVSFSPNTNLTRGQIATILWRMAGMPKVEVENKFPDIKEGQYYYEAVKWASANGIVNGYATTGKFGANNNVTREQLATLLRNYAIYKKKDVKVNTNLNGFKDKYGVSSYAKDGVEWAIANKIMNGKENGTKIDPRGNALRGQIAVMITNYCNKIGR